MAVGTADRVRPGADPQIRYAVPVGKGSAFLINEMGVGTAHQKNAPISVGASKLKQSKEVTVLPSASV